MNSNFLGMDPELAKVAMNKIKTKKAELDTESKRASSALRDKVNNAFAGTATNSMQEYINRINTSLEGLYNYLDGNDSNFANKFNEYIQSYITSDENLEEKCNKKNKIFY